MKLVILDRSERRQVILDRRETGADRFDEVWNGVYLVSPLPDNQHQEIIGNFNFVFMSVLGWTGRAQVRSGMGVSDRVEGWKKNYRLPDVAVFTDDTSARNLGTHWVGGPDFAVEIISRHDRSRKKLDFYAKIGVRELLLVDRYPWALELYRLKEGRLVLVGCSDLDMSDRLPSEILPFSFRLNPGEERPEIYIFHSDGIQRWKV